MSYAFPAPPPPPGGTYAAPAVPYAPPAPAYAAPVDAGAWGTHPAATAPRGAEFAAGSAGAYGGGGFGDGFGGAHPQAGGFGAPGYGGMMGGQAVDVPLHGGAVAGGVTPAGAGGGGGDALPTAADQPVYEPGAKDVWAAVLFWVHALVIVILAFALGVPAMKADGARADNAPRNGALDFNASLFVRMFVLAIFVGGATAVVAFYALKRYASALIKCALYTSIAVQLVLACVMFAFAPIAAFFLLLCAAVTMCYTYYVRPRIPFAAAHLATAVDAVNAYPSLAGVAVGMLALQGLWVLLWSMAALGVAYKANVSAGTSSSGSVAPGGGGGSTPAVHGSAGGGVLVFLLLLSLYWGTTTFRAVVHFVTAAVVGNWWFLGSPVAAVAGSLHRAFTSSFGSLAFGALITSALRALEVMARSAEQRAARSRNAGAAFAAACAVCLLRCLRRAVEYFNQWAVIHVALTGASYTRAGAEAVQLFTKRGWAAVINDDLVGSAMNVVALMVGAVSAAVGGGVAYALSGGAGGAAGVVAFFCFLTGVAMASIMTGVLTSAVRTVFVCFAMNPAALAATHPTQLARLAAAWQVAHPAEFAACGYTAAYAPGGGMA